MDITNQKFGSLTAVQFSHRDTIGNQYWIYRCQCGKLHTARANSVKYIAKKRNDPEFQVADVLKNKEKPNMALELLKIHILYIKFGTE